VNSRDEGQINFHCVNSQTSTTIGASATIPEHRHESQQHIDGRIEHHARLHDERQAHANALQEQHRGKDRGGDVAETRNDSDDGIEAEPNVRAGHPKLAVEEHGVPPQCVEGGVRGRGRSTSQDALFEHDGIAAHTPSWYVGQLWRRTT
jgi:hypothetical protein